MSLHGRLPLSATAIGARIAKYRAFSCGTSLEPVSLNREPAEPGWANERRSETRAMRAMGKVEVTAGLLVIALLPVAAAVPAEPTLPSEVPVAITQPLGAMGTDLLARDGSALPESELLMLVGTGLMGLAAILGRTMRS